jgi:hypothetical protein
MNYTVNDEMYIRILHLSWVQGEGIAQKDGHGTGGFFCMAMHMHIYC